MDVIILAVNQKSYPVELKKQVVEMYFEGYSISDLVKKFDIASNRTVNNWVAKVRKYGFEALNDTRGLHSTGKKKKEEKTIEEKYELLKLENEYLKKLLDLKRG